MRLGKKIISDKFGEDWAKYCGLWEILKFSIKSNMAAAPVRWTRKFQWISLGKSHAIRRHKSYFSKTNQLTVIRKKKTFLFIAAPPSGGMRPFFFFVPQNLVPSPYHKFGFEISKHYGDDITSCLVAFS